MAHCRQLAAHRDVEIRKGDLCTRSVVSSASSVLARAVWSLCPSMTLLRMTSYLMTRTVCRRRASLVSSR